jgi:small subunit ribosomal protein S4
MHRGRERTSYIPFLLNQETRLDVILVRLHFSDTLPQARQLISHRRVCLNNGLVTITHLKVSHGDLISFKENDARTRGEEIRRSFYIDILVGKIVGKFLPAKIWRRTKTEWFRLLTTQRGCRLLKKSLFIWILKALANLYLPGSAFLVGLFVGLLAASSTAMAAGPPDWMTGDPNERLLRKTEKQLLKVSEELDQVTAQAVANAQLFPLPLPGTNAAEQADTIRSILEHDLDGIHLNQRIRRIRKWLQPGEIDNSESLFWVQIIDQLNRLMP